MPARPSAIRSRLAAGAGSRGALCLGAYDLPAPHEGRTIRADEQGRSLQEYFDPQGRTEAIQTVWPVVVPYAA